MRSQPTDQNRKIVPRTVATAKPIAISKNMTTRSGSVANLSATPSMMPTPKTTNDAIAPIRRAANIFEVRGSGRPLTNQLIRMDSRRGSRRKSPTRDTYWEMEISNPAPPRALPKTKSVTGIKKVDSTMPLIGRRLSSFKR